MYPIVIRVPWTTGPRESRARGRQGRDGPALEQRGLLPRPAPDVLVPDFFEPGGPLEGWSLGGRGRSLLMSRPASGESSARELVRLAARIAMVAGGGQLAYSPVFPRDIRVRRAATGWIHLPSGTPLVCFGTRPGDSLASLVETCDPGGVSVIRLDAACSPLGYAMSFACRSESGLDLDVIAGDIGRLAALWTAFTRNRILRVDGACPDPVADAGRMIRQFEKSIARKGGPGRRRPSVPGPEIRSDGRPDPGEIRARAAEMRRKLIEIRARNPRKSHTETVRTQLRWAFREGFLDVSGAAAAPPDQVDTEAWLRRRTSAFMRMTRAARATPGMRGVERDAERAFLEAAASGRRFAVGNPLDS